MRFQIAPAARKTGTLLEQLVREELGRDINGGTVCYGVGFNGTGPALNARCSAMNKLQQAIALYRALGDAAIDPITADEAARKQEAAAQTGVILPMLGRNIQHTKGKDIRLCLEAWQTRGLARVSDFFTPYQPSVGEWRTWVYRKRHLGSYKKELRDPAALKRVGRNHQNGFAFSRVEHEAVPEALKDLSRRAIAALQLDFGAVDTLEVRPGEFVVLEVNAAPGVQDERRAVINNLAHRIVRWAQEGFPNRAAA